ncbi:unnamed protein product, partial [marine sediment metagenome]
MKEGGTFNGDVLRKDFRVLWSTGFFSNIKIEEEQGTKGKIVKITVEENPVIRNIIYKTGRKLKEDDIVKKLKEKEEIIIPYSFYSPYKTQLIKKTVEELLGKKAGITNFSQIFSVETGLSFDTLMSLFGLALIAVLWTYDGWYSPTCTAEEIKKPERNLPLSLILGTLGITLVYLLMNLVYIMALPIDKMKGVTRIGEL